MANDPAFLFYPGDYLRDTQCLSEKTQVAYDRIMCEHMRNTCISDNQFDFFTKKLSTDEVEELKMVLSHTKEGYYIAWVMESLNKRKAYSESRRSNRLKSKVNHKKHVSKISQSYVHHMENENENENENEDINLNRSVKNLSPFEKSFNSYLEMRKGLKKPATEHAKDLVHKKLEKLSGGSEVIKVLILEQSIVNSWQDVFPLREDQKFKSRFGRQEVSNDKIMENAKKTMEILDGKHGKA